MSYECYVYQLISDNYQREKKMISKNRDLYIQYFKFILIKSFLLLMNYYVWAQNQLHVIKSTWKVELKKNTDIALSWLLV